MADASSGSLSSDTTVDDVIDALSKQGISDLPTLAQKALSAAQEGATAGDAAQAVFIHNNFVVTS